MRPSAAVLCHDKISLQILNGTLEKLGMELNNCRSGQAALESVMTGGCRTVIVDFDLPEAREVIRMAALLPPGQKPVLLAIASRAWPGTGHAFQSGASRILYKPLDPGLLKETLQARKNQGANQRKAERYELKTLVYLETEHGTLPGIGIDIGEHGLALQAAEPVPMSSNIAFRCVLPGTDLTLHGRADVMWASEHGRAGLFFTKVAPATRKHLKDWLSKRKHHSKTGQSVRDLLPPSDQNVSFADVTEEELQAQ